jgi:hypothetical protein
VVYQRKSDRYVNATAMCKAAGKLIGHWSQTADTKKVIAALSGSIGIPIDLLVQSIMTGPNAQCGTWVHEKVALHLANWCSPEFYAAVISWTIDTWNAPPLQPDLSDPQVLLRYGCAHVTFAGPIPNRGDCHPEAHAPRPHRRIR